MRRKRVSRAHKPKARTLARAVIGGVIALTFAGTGCFRLRQITPAQALCTPVSLSPVQVLFTSTMSLATTDTDWTQPVNSASNVWLNTPSNASPGWEARTSVTTAMTGALEASYSPDGSKIVFSSEMDLAAPATGPAGVRNIWIMNADGTGLTALTQNALPATGGSSYPSFSPGGGQVVFESVMDPSIPATTWDATPSPGYSNIYVVNTDGTGLAALTTIVAGGGAGANHAVFEGTGAQIAFVADWDVVAPGVSAALPSTNLWIMTSAGAAQNPLTLNTLAGLSSDWPTASLTSTEIAFSSTMGLASAPASWDQLADAQNIWKITSDGVTLTALTLNTAGNGSSLHPSFSPDGSTIAFDSDQALSTTSAAWPGGFAGSRNIWVISSTGTNLTALTGSTGGTTSQWPHISALGSKVVFESDLDLSAQPGSWDPAGPIGVKNVWQAAIDATEGVAMTALTAPGFGTVSLAGPGWVTQQSTSLACP